MRSTNKACAGVAAVPQPHGKRGRMGYRMPPWLKYPGQPPMSLWWRMGSGESYLEEFWSWFGTLDTKVREEYEALFPPPKDWPRAYERGSEEDEDGDEDGDTGNGTAEMQLAAKVGITLWTPTGSTTHTRETLQAEQDAGREPPREFLFFYGHTQSRPELTKACFSQFWKRPGCPPGDILFEYGPFSYVCAEQYMMHNKALVFNNDDVAAKILAETDPFKIKALGRQVRGFDPYTWSVVARSVVCQGNYYKFTASEDLRKFLLDTGDAVLVEASPRDRIWGIGTALPTTVQAEKELSDVARWRGDNWLGFALMDVRDEIRRVYANAELADDDSSHSTYTHKKKA